MQVLVNFPMVGADPFDQVYADQVIEQTKAAGFRVVLERHQPGRNAAILNYLFAEQFRREPEKVASIVMIGNLAAAVTIPAALYWLL